MPGLPDNFNGPFLGTSHQFHFARDYGSIVLQEIAGEEYRFQHIFFHFPQKAKLKSDLVSGFYCFFAALGDARHGFRNKYRTNLRESQFMLLQEAKSGWEIELRSDLPIQLLKLAYSKDSAKELAAAFPSLEPFLSGRQTGIKGPYASHGAIREAVHKILHADYEQERLPFYFKNKIGDFMFEILNTTSEKSLEKPVATEWEKNAVYKVRNMILENILEHHSIADLAKKAKIDLYRLKFFFKNEFGVGPYEFLLNARLEKAKQLMEEGMPMKQAAPLAGYRTTSFITAFKRKFGYSPGKIQKKK